MDDFAIQFAARRAAGLSGASLPMFYERLLEVEQPLARLVEFYLQNAEARRAARELATMKRRRGGRPGRPHKVRRGRAKLR